MPKEPPALTIKSWAEDDRPREKMMLKSKDALSDAELIAIIIGTGSHRMSAVSIAKRIMGFVENDLNELGKLGVGDILRMKIKGVGPAKAISIVAALELSRRRRVSSGKKRFKISNSNDAANLLQPKLVDLPHEEFWVLFINRANILILLERISIGGLSGTIADIRVIFKMAVTNLASSFIVGHNHPSGNLNPSNADIELTKKLVKAGKLLDVKLLDHIIVAGKGFYSFADEGLI